MTMLTILRALEKELGAAAFEIFEWYCKTYGVTIADNAPAIVIREVLG